MGITATDGRLILPVDDPTRAKVTFDWPDVLCEAMARSVEIREARQRVKKQEMQLTAAKNYLLPRIDLDARYHWDGLGDTLVDPGNSDITGGALDNLGSGRFQSWHIGIDGSVPIGFRKQTSGVLNEQLGLARERVKLRDTELEVSHQLSFAVRDMEATYMLTVSNFNRRAAAERQLASVQAVYYKGGGSTGVTFNDILNAQRELAQAESDYFRSLTNYAKSISQVHLRKGSLLEYNGVYLAEGPWPAKAYFDARRRARACAAALCIDYGYSYPKPVSKGPYQQLTNEPMSAEEMPAPPLGKPQPADKQPKALPTPSPKPPAPGLEPALEPAPNPAEGTSAPPAASPGDTASLPQLPAASRDLAHRTSAASRRGIGKRPPVRVRSI